MGEVSSPACLKQFPALGHRTEGGETALCHLGGLGTVKNPRCKLPSTAHVQSVQNLCLSAQDFWRTGQREGHRERELFPLLRGQLGAFLRPSPGTSAPGPSRHCSGLPGLPTVHLCPSWWYSGPLCPLCSIRLPGLRRGH